MSDIADKLRAQTKRAETMSELLKEWRSTLFFENRYEWQKWVGEFGSRVDDATDSWDEAESPDPDAVGAVYQHAWNTRQHAHNDDLDAALAKLEEKP